MNHQNKSLILLLLTVLSLVVSGLAAYLFGYMEIIWKLALVSAIVFGISYLVVDRANLRRNLGKRTTQFGLHSVFIVLVVLAIVIFANAIVVQYDVKKDLTKNKLHTLSEQSIKVLKDLKTEVKVTAYVNPNQIAEFEKIFDKYSYYSKMLKKGYVDMDREPLVVEQHGVKQAGTILVEGDNRTVKIENPGGESDPRLEEKLTNAIIQVTKGGKKKLYYLSGHGEKLLTDTSRVGYSEVKDQLENGRFQVSDLVLLRTGDVPADAEVVICTGPTTEFMDSEIKSLEKYVKGGGKLLMLLEPNSPATLQGFLAKLGVEWHRNKTIFEANGLERTRNPLNPLVDNYSPSSEITQNLRQLSMFSVTTPLEQEKQAPKDFKLISLFSTSAMSYELDLMGDKVNLAQKPGKKGPLTLAFSIVGPKNEKKDEMRVVVVGDSDFASNGMRRYGMNSDLFQNMISWLAKEEDLIAIRPKTQEGGQFDITDYRAQVIFLASVLVLPLFMFGTGITVWWRRRKK